MPSSGSEGPNGLWIVVYTGGGLLTCAGGGLLKGFAAGAGGLLNGFEWGAGLPLFGGYYLFPVGGG